MQHREVTLDDKYKLVEGKAFMTGIQALVRLPLDRKRLDLRQNLNTAGFISGYRGSPLGGYDQQLRAAQKCQHRRIYLRLSRVSPWRI